MTTHDKEILLGFITRTSMYIYPVDEKTVASFVHGYEAGTRGQCNLTGLIHQLLEKKYKIKYTNLGWTGQISRLAQKLSTNWVIAFKKTAIEILMDKKYGGLDEEMKKILKSRIISLIERIDIKGNPWFNNSWIEEWQSLCPAKVKTFKEIWTEHEWAIVKSIDQEVQENTIFSNSQKHIPSLQLIKLKDQFDEHIKNEKNDILKRQNIAQRKAKSVKQLKKESEKW